MQIQFPRRIQMGFRPWYGLTLRQLGYLAIAGVAAGAFVLFGPAEGGGFLFRVLIGLGLISIGVGLAFFRKDGLSAEQWLVTRIKFLLRPQKRVWTRGGPSARDQTAEIRLDSTEQPPNASAPVVETGDERFAMPRLLQPNARAMATPDAVIVLVDLAMLLSLFALGVYLSRGGLHELQGWINIQWGK